MDFVVASRTINGPTYLIYCARGWTARQRRLLRYCGGEASGSDKSLESPGMKPEPTEIQVKMTRPRQAQEVLTGRQDHWRSQRKLEQGGQPRALGPVWSYECELRPRGGPELRENMWNDCHRRERVSLKTVPGLEKRVRACCHWIPEW